MKKQLTTELLLGGCSDDAADIRYITGFTAPGAHFCLYVKPRPVLLVPRLEFGRAAAACRGVDVVTPRQLGVESSCPSRWAEALLKRHRIKRVWVSSRFPFSLAAVLNRAGIKVNSIEGPVFPGRSRKTSLELQRIGESQRAAVAAMRAVRRRLREAGVDHAGFLREGRRRLCSEHLLGTVEAILAQRNCSGDNTIAACGPLSADPHEQGRGPLHAGRPLVVDIFPRHRRHGYWGDLTRTFWKGGMPAPWPARFRAVRRAQQRAMAAIRPRVHGRTIHRLVMRSLAGDGFPVERLDGGWRGMIHATGHGVGLNVHEEPRLADTGGPLSRGQVITVEPGLYFPGEGGVRIEDTVVISAGGAQLLCACPGSAVIG